MGDFLVPSNTHNEPVISQKSSQPELNRDDDNHDDDAYDIVMPPRTYGNIMMMMIVMMMTMARYMYLLLLPSSICSFCRQPAGQPNSSALYKRLPASIVQKIYVCIYSYRMEQ